MFDNSSSLSANSPTLLFDVDGTLIASGELIMECYQQTMERLRLPTLSDEELLRVVGPPLAVTLREVSGLPEEDIDEAVRTYREFYLPRLLEPEPYEGIPELVRELAERGVKLATATSKMEHLAQQQLDHVELSQYFTIIAGSGPENSWTKALVVRRALDLLEEAGHPPRNPVLIGDRSHDVEGAALNSISVIGAGWGYGTPSEFEAPNVIGFARTVADLEQLLIP